jgi:hypothetical protein
MMLDLYDVGGFSGDPNSPNPNFNFSSTCNAHDSCYTFGSSQATCDNSFSSTLTEICSGNYNCQGWADLYSGAVRLDGDAAFDNAKHANMCREIKEDYNDNCDASGISGGGGVGEP